MTTPGSFYEPDATVMPFDYPFRHRAGMTDHLANLALAQTQTDPVPGTLTGRGAVIRPRDHWRSFCPELPIHVPAHVLL